jgi:hypothetical protein
VQGKRTLWNELTRDQLTICSEVQEKKDGSEIHHTKGKEPWPNHLSIESRIPTQISPSLESRTLTRMGKKTNKIT